MNERIFGLALQAMDFHGAVDTDTELKLTNDELKKFAELIVRECIGIAQDRAAYDGFPPNDVNIVIDEIKEHFGVEE